MQELVDYIEEHNKRHCRSCDWLVLTVQSYKCRPYIVSHIDREKILIEGRLASECVDYLKEYFEALDNSVEVVGTAKELQEMEGRFDSSQIELERSRNSCAILKEESKKYKKLYVDVSGKGLEFVQKYDSAQAQCELLRSEKKALEEKVDRIVEYGNNWRRENKTLKVKMEDMRTDLSKTITSVRNQYWEKHAEWLELRGELKDAQSDVERAWNLIKNEEETSKYWKEKFDQLTAKQLDT